MAMETFVFNISKGRIAELVNRVKNNDPANSAIIIVPLSLGDTAANLQDLDDLAAVLAATPNEQTSSWTRKTLTDANLSAIAPDDVNNRMAVFLPAITWTTPTTNVEGFLVCYDPDTTTGTDANIIPLSGHAIAITGAGVDETINAGDFFRGE